MHERKETRQATRRDFLRKMATAGGAAATLAATGGAAAQPATEVAARGETQPTGYRETDHVRAYYRTARS